MKLWCRHVAILFLVAAVGGIAVALSGIIPITASSGHWPATRRVLDFSMARSVATHSAGITAPDHLDDASLMITGAGHYHTGCVQCHGSPERPPSPIARAMTPRPPVLSEKVELWSPAELFYIVKHGVKLTGMPAWPAEGRDDEVWAVVAFLQRLSDLDRTGYRELIYGVPADESFEAAGQFSGPDHLRQLVTETCGRCHGPDGRGRSSTSIPSLAGQRSAYLSASLQAYADGERPSGIMEPLAVALTEREIADVAEFYSQLAGPAQEPEEDNVATDTVGTTGGSGDDEDESTSLSGAEIARNGIPSLNVPACTGCHGPAIGGSYPLLAGQPATYLSRQLQLFKKRKRGGTDNADLMHPATKRITTEQIKTVSDYYARLRRAR